MINIKDESDVQIWCDYQEEKQQTSADYFLRLRFGNFHIFLANNKDYSNSYAYDNINGNGWGHGEDGDADGSGWSSNINLGDGWGNCLGNGFGYGIGDRYGNGTTT